MGVGAGTGSAIGVVGDGLVVEVGEGYSPWVGAKAVVGLGVLLRSTAVFVSMTVADSLSV